MNAPTKAIIETIGGVGYRVVLNADAGHHVVEAFALDCPERFIVRGTDLYEVATELAGQVGIELEDG